MSATRSSSTGTASSAGLSIVQLTAAPVFRVLMPTSLTAAHDGTGHCHVALSEIMRGSQVPPRDAAPADAPGHGHAREDARRVIRGNGRLPLIVPQSYPGGEAPGS